MGLCKRNNRAGLQGHDRDMHIMAQIVQLDEPRRRPSSVGFRHRAGWHIFFIGHKRVRAIEPHNRLIVFADPVKPRRTVCGVAYTPTHTWWQISIATLLHQMARPFQVKRKLALNDEQNRFGPWISLRLIATATGLNFANILRKRLSKSRQWARQNPKPRAFPKG